MIRFTKTTHTLQPEIEVMEVRNDEELVAVIYPEGRGVRIISKFLSPSEPPIFDLAYPPKLIVTFATKIDDAYGNGS